MKKADNKINSTLKKQIKQTFIQALTDLRDTNETKKFVDDFFSDSEVDIYVKRLAIAYWLKKGRSYKNIRENLKVSSATIAAVNSIVKKPGVKLILKKIEAEEWANQWAEKIKKFIK